MSATWPFSDPPNVVVFTSKDVIEAGKWIYYVSHDEDDGAWQFHSVDGAPRLHADARVVLLRNIAMLDPTIMQLADLPVGWMAWRDSPRGEWKRKRMDEPVDDRESPC